MTPSQIDEIIACLPSGRTPFAYWRDRYALELVAAACREATAIAMLKRSAVAPLLERPAVKRHLAQAGGGHLDAAGLRSSWCDQVLGFDLSVGAWAYGHGKREHRWNQTSRPGANLVLQLNLPSSHDAEFQRLVQPDDHALLRYQGHPIHRRYRTLAWARLDVDLDRGEALIEELQTDWVRDVDDALRWLERCGGEADSLYGCRIRGGRRGLERYRREALAPYAAVWDEAMLFAALWFLQVELGIRRIWYHSFASGQHLKRFDHRDHPPRSLYERLPRRFCFQRTCDKPELLLTRCGRKRRRDLATLPMYRCPVEGLAA